MSNKTFSADVKYWEKSKHAKYRFTSCLIYIIKWAFGNDEKPQNEKCNYKEKQ